MALFGPQARLERCLWWAELTSWPHGATPDRRARCYDKIFGRSVTPMDAPASGNRYRSATTEVEPKNDLLMLVAGVAIIFLVWKYLIKK